MAGDPRRTVEPSYAAQEAKDFRELARKVAALERAGTLRNVTISGGLGLRVVDADGKLRITLNTSDGAVVAYDSDENPAARFGPLTETAPDQFGVEVDVDGTWVQLGRQTTTWASVSGKPTDFGPLVSSQVPAAAQADGSQYGWTNNVAGTSFYALWVGNDGGFHFGRNVSSIRYKENVRDHQPADPKAVLQLRPVLYDRKPQAQPLPEGQIGPEPLTPGAKNEFGLIAEEVKDHLPEVIQYFEGQVDGVRYDLIVVALIPVVREHEDRIAKLEKQVDKLTKAVQALGGQV